MKKLFETGIIRDARLSPDGLYRYTLSRKWGDGHLALFIGLNPSTADAEQDDPTVRRLIGFAKSWECGGFVLVNLFAFRATKPEDMKASADPVGPGNDETIKLFHKQCAMTVACWGSHGTFRGRDREVVKLLTPNSMVCLGMTQGGHPRHPLYLKSDTQLEPYP